MDPKILSALIAGSISLCIALITHQTTLRKVKHENKLHEKETKHKYTERLYELRLENYPLAFEITDKLGKKLDFSPQEIPLYYKEVEKQLRNWKSGEVSLILSDKSLDAYYGLIKSFKAQLALGNQYNQEQLERIYNLRTTFRNMLRNDVGLLYEHDKENTNE